MIITYTRESGPFVVQWLDGSVTLMEFGEQNVKIQGEPKRGALESIPGGGDDWDNVVHVYSLSPGPFYKMMGTHGLEELGQALIRVPGQDIAVGTVSKNPAPLTSNIITLSILWQLTEKEQARRAQIVQAEREAEQARLRQAAAHVPDHSLCWVATGYFDADYTGYAMVLAIECPLCHAFNGDIRDADAPMKGVTFNHCDALAKERMFTCDSCGERGMVSPRMLHEAMTYEQMQEHTHDKVYAPFQYPTDPPQQPWICRTCGIEGVDTLQTVFNGGEYDRLKDRFGKISPR